MWRALAGFRCPGERVPVEVPMLGRVSRAGGPGADLGPRRRRATATSRDPLRAGRHRQDAPRQRVRRVLRARGTLTWSSVRSLPYGEVLPYGAFATQVKQVARIFDTDEAGAACEKLDAAIAELLDGEAREVSSHIATADRPRARRRRRRAPDALLLGSPHGRGAREGATDGARLRGHPLGGRGHARPPRGVRLARPRRPAAPGRAGPSRPTRTPPVLGRRAARVHGASRRGPRRRACAGACRSGLDDSAEAR